MMDRITSSDNPNYFDEQAAAGSNEQSSRSFFLFKKRNSNSQISPAKPTYYQNSLTQQQQTPANKRRSSFKGILRSRSNSASSSTIRADAFGRNHAFERASVERGCYNENTSENSANDDVFYTNSTTDSKYKGACQNARAKRRVSSEEFESRRHSIGTLAIREPFRSGSISDEVPKMLAPKAPTIKKNQNEQGDSLTTTVDDILFVLARHSEQSMVWVNHLKTCFDKITKQRGRLPFNFLHIKIDEDQITKELAQRCQSTKLQIVIICPMLLSIPAQCLMETFSQILKPERVLGMLLDIAETSSWEKLKHNLPSYHKWRTCTVGDHEQSFVSELLGMATDILGRALRQQPLLSPSSVDRMNCAGSSTQKSASTGAAGSATAQHETFTLFPRKVKIGQNKIIIILVGPLQKDDWVKIKIEKSNEVIEITNIKRRNPYTIQFNIPETCMEISMMVGVRLIKNNVDLGSRPLKCESRLRELEQILKTQDTPMEFLCQSIGIAVSDRDKLDSYLLQSFQKNVPTNFHLLNSADAANKITHRETNPEEYPTLLHFAANFGLERLCLQLMECPGGDVACGIRNICGRTPADLAEHAGHFKLANSFKNFFQMHEFTTMYYYFKGISESSPDKIVIQPKSSRVASSCKSMAAADAPLPLASGDSSPTSPLLRHPQQSEGYMDMNGSGSDIESGHNEIFNSVSNLNYLNVNVACAAEHDEVDFAYDIGPTKKDQDVLNNLNSQHESDDHNSIMFNELKITESESFESGDANNRNDQFSQECSTLLENCNMYEDNNLDYIIQPSNLPVRQLLPDETTESDYLVQPSNMPVHEYSNFEYTNDGHALDTVKPLNVNRSSGVEASHLRLSFKKKEHKTETISRGRTQATLTRQESDVSKRSVDDELLEIISDFKNNVFTIQEVEQLVASWKSRNDVQKSFKDKQEQLQRMREEYERIQQQMKEKLKRPTPFERMKKMFFKTKSPASTSSGGACSTEQSDICDDIKFAKVVSNAQASHRPTSSSSLHSISSGSSGRMSSISGASIGDSGTHSDSEELRFGFTTSASGNKLHCQANSLENYMVPPAPRPVLESTASPSFRSSNNPYSIANRAADEHYAIFPSNIPVTHDFNDYKNLNVLKPIDEAKEADTSVQSITIQRQDVLYSNVGSNKPSMSSFKAQVKCEPNYGSCEEDN